MKRLLLFIPIILTAFNEPSRVNAFTALGSGAFFNNKTAGTTWAIATTLGYASGTLVILCIANDNLSTTDGDNGDVISVSDNNGNSYTKAKQFTNGQGSAASGACSSIWFCIMNGSGIGTTTTVTFNGSVTAKAAHFRSFSIGSGNQVVVQASGTIANDGADAGSISLSSLPSKEYLFVRSCAIENNTATNTTSTNYTQLTGQTGTTGGSSVTNMWIQSEYRIVTATSSSTDPTTGSADIASTMVAFYEAPAGNPRRITVIQ